MANIHWLGTGLSAIPGLKMLIENGHSVVVYLSLIHISEPTRPY